MLGSVAERIYRQASIPVLTIGPSVRHLLIADPSRRARQLWRSDARITLGIYGHIAGDEQAAWCKSRG